MKTINKSGVERIRDIEHADRNAISLCRCPLCGGIFTMWRSHFYRGSNGCKCRYSYHKEERLYGIWENMKTRCSNPRVRSAKHYLFKGITVCEEWSNSYESFRAWALSNGYNEDLTIDRIDNNKGYYPENCRWATYEQQARNKSNTVWFFVNGKRITAKECGEILGIHYKTIMSYVYTHGKDAAEKRLNDLAKQLRLCSE